MKKGKKPKGIPSNLLKTEPPAELAPFTSPNKIVLPLATPWAILSPLVSPGDEVIQDQIVAHDEKGLAPPLYSPVSGKVREIGDWITASGTESPSIILDTGESSGPSTTNDLESPASLDSLSAEEIFYKIRDAGIRESDNYPWPLAWRLAQPGVAPQIPGEDNPNLSKPIDYLIINALDRQPGSSLRYLALKSNAKTIPGAISLLQKVSGAQNTILAISETHNLGAEVQSALNQSGMHIQICPDRYPLALEPLLVQYITGREVPQPSGDSRAVGVCVVDIVAALQAQGAVQTNSPITRVPVQMISYSNGINHQTTVPIGCLIKDMLGVLPSEPKTFSKVILGGIFLGNALHTLEVPITGAVDVIYFQSRDEITTYEDNPCINCGKCVDVCPMGLMPNELGKFCEYEDLESAKKNFLFHCIECGLCSFVCPARRPMVHLIRFGKNEILKATQQ